MHHVTSHHGYVFNNHHFQAKPSDILPPDIHHYMLRHANHTKGKQEDL